MGEGADPGADSPQVYALEALAEHPFFGRLFTACSALSEDFAGVYLVGGFVRDLLLEQPNVDVDVAVEGDGIEFAGAAGQRAGRPGPGAPQVQDGGRAAASGGLGRGPARPARGQRALSRGRSDHPNRVLRPPGGAAAVEHASIRQDLFRRDFTINAMAISLRGRDFGTVVDFFGGYRDLRGRRDQGASQSELHRRPHQDLPGGALREPLRLPHGRAHAATWPRAASRCTWWAICRACGCVTS